MERRSFVQKVTLASAGTVVSVPLMKSAWANSPNESVNIAIIGIRSRGKDHYRALAQVPNVNIA
ncbi:MAG TPA: hypothetical protein VKA38_13285, partial [Draconibacterium sp.]|nr:hypothetical protein [Draconibacterium sp.]